MKNSQRQQRSGAALLAALICLLVVAMVVAAMATSISLQLRSSQVRANRLQATWLARAAVSKAENLLADNPEYAGETWKVTSEELGSKSINESQEDATGAVTISVTEESGAFLVSVEATFPANSETPYRVKRTVRASVHKSPTDSSATNDTSEE